MSYEELRDHVDTLEQHVARLESVIQVMLEEIEAGTIRDSAASIRAALQQSED